MKIFETVKQSVTARQAAERYGLEVNAHGMALCPFHADYQPSLKLDERFYCFGCHASGDVIDFTAKLFGISPKDAAQKLAEDFGITSRSPTEINIPKRHAEPRPDLERLCISVLRDYLRLLRIWRLRYEPAAPGEPMDDRFVESCQMEETVNAFLDALIDGTPALRERVVGMLLKDGSIYELQAYVERRKEEPSYAGKYQPCA
ncbi:MAG: CHC2 zinc finger domain-containing protein [Eubacteriales bacterium]|nr:CHC2 zinc finger domain-containing protein [Eubacteriales bacterium]